MRHRLDLPGQIKVTLAHPVVVVRYHDQPHDHAGVLQVDVEVMVLGADQLTYRFHEPGSGRERSSAEERARSFDEHTPALDTITLLELRARDLLSHISSYPCGFEVPKAPGLVRGMDIILIHRFWLDGSLWDEIIHLTGSDCRFQVGDFYRWKLMGLECNCQHVYCRFGHRRAQ
jgi:hypothetical protein